MKLESIKQAFFSKGFKYLKVELEAEVQPTEDYQERECYECGGYGCAECHDSGYLNEDNWHEPYLEDFKATMFNRLPAQIREKIKYNRFYNDGSVDTEMTFTISINYLEHLPEIIYCFKEACLEYGDCKTDNAGMHITLLCGYKYPSSHQLDREKIKNFKQEVSKLLLALSVFASPNNKTRAFEFRELQVSSTSMFSSQYLISDENKREIQRYLYSPRHLH